MRSDQPYIPPANPTQQPPLSTTRPPIISFGRPEASKKPVTRPQGLQSTTRHRAKVYDANERYRLEGLTLDDHEESHESGFNDPTSSTTTINIQGGSDVSISFARTPSRSASRSPAAPAIDLTKASRTSGRPVINQVIVNLLESDSRANKSNSPTFPKIIKAIPPPEPPKKDTGLNINCGICLDKISQPAATPCGHVFCYQCLTLSQRAQKQCPLCRKPLTVRQIHKLFI